MSQVMAKKFKGRLAVLLGGESAERDVSLLSGNRILDALVTLGIDAQPIDCKTSDLITTLRANDINHCFIALHGGDGEDGTIQSILKSMSIGFTGGSAISSGIAMDKQRSKLIWKGANMPTADFCMVNEYSIWADISQRLGGKIMIKPSQGGSSIGMAIVESEDGFMRAINDAKQYDHEVMAERWIEGKEYTVGILGDNTLPTVCLQTNNAFYDYEAKYLSDETQYFCPCGLDQATEIRLAKLAMDAFRLLGCSGWGRVDFMMDENGQEYLLEVNTQPGMTTHSLVPIAAAAAGVSFEELVLNILEASL